MRKKREGRDLAATVRKRTFGTLSLRERERLNEKVFELLL